MKVKVNKERATRVPKPRPEADLDLMNIYKNGKKEEMGSLEGRPKSETLRRVLGGAAFLVCLAAVGWWFFRPAQDAAVADVRVVAPDLSAAKAGAFVEVPITVENNRGVDITNVTLEALPPTGWVTKETEPAAAGDKALSWKIERIDAGSSVTLKIRGWFLQPVGARGAWSAHGTYRPANFSSDFPLDAAWNADVASSAYALSWKQDEAGLASFASEEQNVPEGLELRVNWPARLVKPSYEPAPVSADPLAWSVPATSQHLDVKFSPKAGADLLALADGTPVPPGQEFAAGLELWWRAAANATAVKLLAADAPLKAGSAASNSLKLSLAVNGDAAAKTADWGQPLRWEFTIDNPTAQALSDGQFRLFMSGDAIKEVRYLNEAKKTSVPLKFEDALGYVSFEAKDIPSLKAVKPQSKTNLAFVVALKQYAELAGTDLAKEYSLNGYGELQAKTDNAGVMTEGDKPEPAKPGTTSLKTDTKKIQLNGFWTARSALKYYSDEQLPLGVGPMPFKAGEQTTVTLQNSITVLNHTVQSLSVKYQLPPDVSFVGADENAVGTWAYDEAKRVLAWTLNQVPAATGAAGRVVPFSARISIKPSAASDKAVTLLPAATVEGKDAVTGGATRYALPALTSAMEGDPFAKNAGAVQAASAAQ